MLAVSRDHPRACGEHVVSLYLPYALAGSSPRMRGTHGRLHQRQRPDGIIPAHAGNTCCRESMSRCSQDHPRACGEHEWASPAERDAWGSSPRMRGTLDVECRGQRLHGIIPAHAGNTAVVVNAGELRRDHPRACGEHSATAVPTNRRRGSSPRMRGTLCLQDY